LRRPDAARFSFLLATPIIFGAGLFKLLDLLTMSNPLAQVPALAAGFVTAAIVGYLCIWGLLRYLQRGNLYPFAIYCACLGLFCLVVAWLR
jgi:undecaprenyl-diphosphatase